ncbi:hypothetical protein RRU94_15820 [Domibacillus sp. DTU_2020_1001157_1_SI_ALB_TIR_016]|uniref:hypothetical protein n=1 Tax=Domibacillus sp. DTU_2020_1001157_1_SI_ALB_TIR_016 TaxID=3077789 RepID=UPI0028ECE6E0|nr:hypothetical protein [Domibacillus sp. DTU_2020_1001157_1_SI_ALB_TIR_016]WNS82210.1 hypothetical protein RRU94_15820 [Domibacillus sp. DTU_2020_1001157_1_SI_ALB_TIR_016]
MLYLYEIRKLIKDIEDFQDPLETIECLHIRSEFNEVYDHLTKQEKKELDECDHKIREKAVGILKHLELVHDFRKSKQSDQEWWWHLDKVISGEIDLGNEEQMT